MDSGQLQKGIKAGIGFLTTIPVGVDEAGFGIFTENIHIFVIVGAIAGLLLGATGFILGSFMPVKLVPVLMVAAIFLLTGINHLDGLSDTGDGIIASGTREKKVAAMKDVHAGAGGILFIGMDLLFIFSAVSLFAGFGSVYLMIGLFVAEVCAKLSMTTVAAFGKSLHPGMGSMFIEKTKKEHYLIGLAIAIIACMAAMSLPLLPFIQPYFWRPYGGILLILAGFLAAAASVGVGLIMVDIANDNFGGVNGDVMGAANEIGRIVALVILGTLIWMLW